jgi:hypothetical protein
VTDETNNTDGRPYSLHLNIKGDTINNTARIVDMNHCTHKKLNKEHDRILKGRW